MECRNIVLPFKDGFMISVSTAIQIYHGYCILLPERKKRSSWMDWVWQRLSSWGRSQRSMSSRPRSTGWWSLSSTLCTETKR